MKNWRFIFSNEWRFKYWNETEYGFYEIELIPRCLLCLHREGFQLHLSWLAFTFIIIRAPNIGVGAIAQGTYVKKISVLE